jgi:PAS domain S-box-containing protein
MTSVEAVAAALEPTFRANEDHFRSLAEALPVAIYTTDPSGWITFYNEAAVAFWGHRPELGGAQWCGSWKLYRPDGTPLPHEQCPMAIALRQKRPVRGLEAVAERPDGVRVPFMPYPIPMLDSAGRLIGAVNVLIDISEQKRVEAALARRASEQSALFRFTDRLHRARTRDAIYEAALDAIGSALNCDRAAVLLFDETNVMRFAAWRGLSNTYRTAVDGHSPWNPDTVDPQPICIDDVNIADLPAGLRASITTEGIAALAFIPVIADGRLVGKFMTYYTAPHRFTDGEVELSVAIGRQLGFSIARMRSGEAAQRLASIIESSDDAIVSKDLNGVVTSWNRGAQRIFGYSAADMIGQPIMILIPPDRHDEEPEILERIRRGERVEHFETIRQRKNGSLVDISVTISPVKDADGRIIGASKIARDITDRKRAEAALRDSERRLQELLAAIPAAIYTTDAAGTITYFNEAAVALTGHEPKVGVDKWTVGRRHYRPDGTPLPPEECPMAIALREGRIIRNMEAMVERPDGARVPFIPYPTPLRDAVGNVVGGINMMVDISERKQSETHQRVLLRELNHRVKNNMQILHVLLNSALRSTGNPEARNVLEDASRRVGAMAAAQQVLYGASGGTAFNAAEFLQTVCRTAQQTFAKNVTIAVETAQMTLSNDTAAPLALILNELLTNAVKHGLNGRLGAIRVALRRDERQFTLIVEDDGPGFDLLATTRRSSGLALVQALARQLRGRLEVTRTPATRCALMFNEAADA